jgi:hypothetical protein
VEVHPLVVEAGQAGDLVALGSGYRYLHTRSGYSWWPVFTGCGRRRHLDVEQLRVAAAGRVPVAGRDQLGPDVGGRQVVDG